MSDGDVSLIRDEDVLRRMWQQTEDFSRKKEIRAHMYRLREERLRNLYSPEPTIDGKGCEFTSTQGHVKSFADQSFQSMKSKEVRDAGSPPKEFTYRGQDLKDLSNAGWNVESENRTTDDGHTHVKSVHANIQGRYDVEGGKGQFAAEDHHKQAVTEYHDDTTSLKRNEDYSNTSAREQVVRQTDDGSHFSSTTSSSTSTSKFEQVSSKHETVPYLTNDDYDQVTQKAFDTNSNYNKEITSNRQSKTSNYEQNLRNDYEHGELVSRKIDYPDDNTKVIVETRCLPDGTRVTSTRREFRAPSVQTSRSEHHSQQIRNESKSSMFSSTARSEQLSRSETNSSSKIIRDTIDDNTLNIVDSQRTKDDFDFRKEPININESDIHQEYINRSKAIEKNNREIASSREVRTRHDDNKEVNEQNKINKTRTLDEINTENQSFQNIHSSSYENKNTNIQNVKENRYYKDNGEHILHVTSESDVLRTIKNNVDDTIRKSPKTDLTSNDDNNIGKKNNSHDSRHFVETEESVQNISKDLKEEKKITDQYQTTYQSDYTQRKVSKEWSPTHQAWASTLRSDTPSRPTTRASSPGSKTFKSSDSSLRSSVSPDKNYRKTPSRGGSPTKIDRSSPLRTSDRYSNTQTSSYSVSETRTNKYSDTNISTPKSQSPTRRISPEKKSRDETQKPKDMRSSESPEKHIKTPDVPKQSTSPQRQPEFTTAGLPRSSPSPDRKTTPMDKSPSTVHDISHDINSSRTIRENVNIENTTTQTEISSKTTRTTKDEKSPSKPSYMRDTVSSSPKKETSPQPKFQDGRKSPNKYVDTHSPEHVSETSKTSKTKEEHEVFVSEERRTDATSYDKHVKGIERNLSPTKRNDSANDNTAPKTFPTKKSSVSPERKTESVRRSPSNEPNEKNACRRQSPEKSSTNTDRLPSREASPLKRNMSPDKNSQSRDTSPLKRHMSPDNKYRKEHSRSPSVDSSPREVLTPSKDSLLSRKSPTRNENVKKDTSLTTNVQTTLIDASETFSSTNTENVKTIRNVSNVSTTLNKPSPRRSVSPTKPSTKEGAKHQNTSEFIAMERTHEEMNKRKVTERPRKLVTPSTSPTRKAKLDETAQSSGQSSPTTTASGFIYYGSPKYDNPVVTDLDDKVPRDNNNSDDMAASRPLHSEPVRRTPSPTKIPSRSPSPEKRVIKENLPRKSSLKKPSVDNSYVSPVDKPATSFLISPEAENKNAVDSAMPKDKPEKKETPFKTKPPLERRETYEERCRKILGMTEDSNTSETKTTTYHVTKSTDTSPSISPCESPVQFEEKPLGKNTYEKVDVVDISNETSVTCKTEDSSSYNDDNNIRKNNNYSSVTNDHNVTLSDLKTINEKVASEYQLKEDLKKETYKTAQDANAKQSLSKTSTIYNARTSPERTLRKSPEKIVSQQKNNTIHSTVSDTKKETRDSQKEETIRQTIINNATDSIIKNDERMIEKTTEFILSEKEQQILNRVQSSLRKLSPDRKKQLPIQEKTNDDSDVRLSDNQNQDIIDSVKETITEEKPTVKNNLIRDKQPGKIQSKPSSRNVSPNKKTSQGPSSPKSAPESGKVRSTSPKKPLSPVDKKPGSPIERPQSPQVPKSTNKTKEPVSPQYNRTSSVSTLKNEKIVDVKKSTTVKQNSSSRLLQSKASTVKNVSTLKQNDVEPKRTQQFKGKISDTKVTRTFSDVSLKSPTHKKVSPQRIKSKPEIQVTSVITTKGIKHTTVKNLRSSKESSTKLPVSKPKSAIDLNTSVDEDDIIIDVQQAKSSRENSPDRICPTPLGFAEDVGTPRLPDEVNEPDDEFLKRTHHVIHEAESIVDDIVEISEDDELFVKRNEDNIKDNKEEYLFDVNSKVSNFTKKTDINRTKDSTSSFKDTEIRKHSDQINENLKSDECLLSVSEKVNKFAKGQLISKDKSPSRNIAEEFDKDTIYQDDYTKLSVNDKAHLFIETAENVKTTKQKPAHKPERPDLSNVEESLRSDECLLSVSDKVNKFVKTAEQILSDAYIVEERERKIKEQHDKIMKQIVENDDDTATHTEKTLESEPESQDNKKNINEGPTEERTLPKSKITHKVPEKTPVKITTLRSSEAVKKAKALFENIATTTSKTKESVQNKNTKLNDIGVSKNATKVKISDTAQKFNEVKPITEYSGHKEEDNIQDTKGQRPESPNSKPTLITTREKSPMSRTRSPITRDKSPFTQTLKRESSPVSRTLSPITRDKSPASGRKSPIKRTKSPLVRDESPTCRTRSPNQNTTSSPKKVLSRFPLADSKPINPEEKPEIQTDKVPGYQRPTKTSQLKEEKTLEEIEVSSRRGSGKFGVELRRTSADRSSVSSERRRSSEHHQPCIEDIFDLDLLEQMLEKVVGYEQRRRIRAQIRVARKQMEVEKTNTTATHRTTKQTIKVSKTKSPERQPQRSPDRQAKQKPHSPERLPKTPHKTSSPERQLNTIVPSEELEYSKPVLNGQPNKVVKDKETRPRSPEKQPKAAPPKATRPTSPDKKSSRPLSPSKAATPKSKSNRFSEYASAYMKKVGLNDSDKPKVAEAKTKKAPVIDEAKTTRIETSHIETHHSSRTYNERTSSKDTIEIVQTNGKKSPSPDRIALQKSYNRTDSPGHHRKQSPERKPIDKVTHERKPSPQRKSPSPERRYSADRITQQIPTQRSPSPETKTKTKKETIIKTVVDIEKKIPQKKVQDEKPSWVTNRNLKKVTSETRSFSSKKIEVEKPKYRASSPSKAITKPIDVITSSYGPGPLDADGRPLFGIKALRNGATNYQVKGTVIRQEYHSKNGGEPQGTVSVTAYSTEPEDLERLLQAQGEKPSRLHGLAAITTTKKFGGDTGTTFSEVTTKEERAALDQFTHSDRRVQESYTERLSNNYDAKDSHHAEQFERITEIGSREIGTCARDEIDDTKRRTNRTEGGRKEVEKVNKRTEKMQKIESRVDEKKTVRQSSVKSLTEKFIKNASETSKSERSAYPKAGLILRTTNMKDSVSSDSSAQGLARTDSDHSLASIEDMVTTTTTTTRERHGDVVTTTTTRAGKMQERSFLDSTTKVTGVQDILTRMKNADIVIEEGDTSADSEARALLNKFLGASVLMAGMRAYVTDPAPPAPPAPPAHTAHTARLRQETIKTHSSAGKVTSSRQLQEIDIEQCWDERVLRKLLDECTDYEVRRRLRARIRALMAEQEACASAVTEALAAAGETVETVETEEQQQSGEREEEEVTTVTSSVRRDSCEKTVSSTTIKNTKVVESMRPAPKPVSPFAKFRQLEKQNSTNSPNSAKSPQSPGSPSQPYFKFTDPALQLSAATIKERLLQWCRDKTRDYENVKLENFSTSWADGLAFCALLHHFLPDAFDYSQLTPSARRHNFTLAFKVADEKAGIYPLLDVDDMVAMRKPDWKCVFTYVQSIHRRFKDEP